jgi:hypothetical protein
MSFKLTKLSLDQLQELYRDTERICDAIMLFINQKEIIAEMLNNIPNTAEARYDSHLRKRQDKYFSGIKTSLNTLFATFSKFSKSKLLDILQLGDKFVFVNNITRNGMDQHLDYPYQNWIDNIAELWLRYAECYADMFKQMIDLETPKKVPSVVVSSIDVPSVADTSVAIPSVGQDISLDNNSLLPNKICQKNPPVGRTPSNDNEKCAIMGGKKMCLKNRRKPKKTRKSKKTRKTRKSKKTRKTKKTRNI